MTSEQAIEILKLYRNWNIAQKGINEDEEKLLSHRRALMTEAHIVLLVKEEDK